MEGSLVTLNPVDIGLLLPGAVAVCLLAVSALVSGAETSFFSLTPHDIRDIKAHPEKSSNDAILRLLGDVDQLLATILVVNNLVNICIVILAARIINLLFTFGSAGMRFLFESVIATFLLLLFGEIIPKVFAQSRPLRFARTVARLSLGLVGLSHDDGCDLQEVWNADVQFWTIFVRAKWLLPNTG